MPAFYKDEQDFQVLLRSAKLIRYSSHFSATPWLLPQYQPFKKCVIKNNARSSCNDLTTECSPTSSLSASLIQSSPLPPICPPIHFQRKRVERGEDEKRGLQCEKMSQSKNTHYGRYTFWSPEALSQITTSVSTGSKALSLSVFHTVRINGKPPLTLPRIFHWYSYLVSVFLFFTG